MINKKELYSYARLRKLNLGQAEIDYLITIILFLLSKYNNLVFKGGTALSKAYNLDRFSNDLDFNIINKFNLNDNLLSLAEEIKQFGINVEIKQIKGISDSLRSILRIEGPLYLGTINSKCNVILDFSFREKLMFPAQLKKINHQLNEIPIFDINVMDIREIFAEKIRAILTRNKARDLYDAYYLLKQNININLQTINEKLNYYHEGFSFEKFKEAVNKKENIWNNELKLLLKNVPDFNMVKKELSEFIKHLN